MLLSFGERDLADIVHVDFRVVVVVVVFVVVFAVVLLPDIGIWSKYRVPSDFCLFRYGQQNARQTDVAAVVYCFAENFIALLVQGMPTRKHYDVFSRLLILAARLVAPAFLNWMQGWICVWLKTKTLI